MYKDNVKIAPGTDFNDTSSSQDLLIVKTANEFIEEAKNKPIPKALFAELWHEGEFCILFAGSGVGKSILAVQVANSITTGIPIEGFTLKAESQAVLYFDFELSPKQFENRYSNNYTAHYRFSDSLFRIELNPDSDSPDSVEGFEVYLLKEIENVIIKTSAKVLILDNLTYLKSDTEKARNVLPLVRELKKLKSRYGLSILALAHTPKRDLSRPITKNDLAGSSTLMNFIDSCFAIGESSTDKDIRYIKQIKERATAKIYDSDHIIVCQVQKPSNFLHFKFLEYGTESYHLKEVTDKEKSDLEQNIIDARQQQPTLSYEAIAAQLGTNKMKVSRVLKKYNDNPEAFNKRKNG